MFADVGCVVNVASAMVNARPHTPQTFRDFGAACPSSDVLTSGNVLFVRKSEDLFGNGAPHTDTINITLLSYNIWNVNGRDNV